MYFKNIFKNKEDFNSGAHTAKAQQVLIELKINTSSIKCKKNIKSFSQKISFC